MWEQPVISLRFCFFLPKTTLISLSKHVTVTARCQLQFCNETFNLNIFKIINCCMTCVMMHFVKSIRFSLAYSMGRCEIDGDGGGVQRLLHGAQPVRQHSLKMTL